MAVGFGGVTFAVLVDDDGNVPLPVGGDNENAPRTYQATLRMTSGTAVSDLRALLSIATVVPALGFVGGGTVVVEAGPGTRTLTWPTANAAELSADAILTYVSPVASVVNGEYRVDASWLLVE